MIFKGFKDENGNIIPVQGAGTVYNEEKNSLALGKDTVATGEDQFVFGRNNVEDMEDAYAEIVGGGGEETETETETTSEGIIELLEALSVDSQVTITASRLANSATVKKIGNNKNEMLAWFSTNNLSISELNITGVSDSDVLAFFLSDYPYVVDREEKRYLRNLKIVKTDGSLVMTGSTISKDGNTYTINNVDSLGNLTSATTIVTTVERTNIRTLDWEGNEELAGGLTVGTGITIGETSLSEAELTALKALLNS